MMQDNNGPVEPVGLGSLAWLAEFDEDDRREALAELRDALALSIARSDPEPLREALHAWRTTAAVMRDPLSRAILTGPLHEDDFVDAPEPGRA